MFHIFLENEQEALLCVMVEAAWNVSREERQKFLLVGTYSGYFLQHPGFTARTHVVYEGDVDTLVNERLLARTYGAKGSSRFDVTPLGFEYYRYLKHQEGQPINRVQQEIRNYIDADSFQKAYPAAYQKWTEAEKLLWSAESAQHLSTIGHLCREAMQQFADALAAKYSLEVPTDKAKDVARIRAVIEHHRKKLGDKKRAFLDATMVYWGTMSDLVQRQEHAGQREGEPLTWEDGRRVVFQTLVVMVECDKAL